MDLFRKGKTHIIAKFHRTEREENQINTVHTNSGLLSINARTVARSAFVNASNIAFPSSASVSSFFIFPITDAILSWNPCEINRRIE